jgi:SagB-type dehydrogenase family enzyme
MPALFRRSRWLRIEWAGERFEVSHDLARTRLLVSAEDAVILCALTFWRTSADLVRRFPHRGQTELAELLTRFHAARLVERADDLADPRGAAMRGWQSWYPVASRFHLATRDIAYAERDRSREILTAYLAEGPPPSPLKALAAEAIALPAMQPSGEFPDVLRARRSWRSFAQASLSIEQVSTLAGLTFAVQQWAEIDGQEIALKTSPSGGACHGIEAYWAVRRIDGLADGLYYYAPDLHALVPVSTGWRWDRVLSYFPGQPWFADANAIVLMTCVFERTRWKYRHSRAYRVVLLEAGHLCQTFCLAATWMGLAPFCSAALADSEIERDLGIDGLSEAVLYAAGAGVRPPGVSWAPWPSSTRQPPTRPPSHARPPRRDEDG